MEWWIAKNDEGRYDLGCGDQRIGIIFIKEDALLVKQAPALLKSLTAVVGNAVTTMDYRSHPDCLMARHILEQIPRIQHEAAKI